MKKILLLSTVLVLALLVQAQNYESIKNNMILGTPAAYKKSKDDLDKAMSNAKFAAKPEAYILKATIYAGMAMDSATRLSPEGEKLTAEAEAAFAKYKEMQPDLSLLTDPIYRNGPINLYSSLFSSGYKDYEKKNWVAGLEKFKKVVDLSDLLIAKKLINLSADTNSILLAGIMAENAGQKEEAVKYYGRMADMKVRGDGFEGIYRYLVNYYAVKKDMANFEKYKTTGKELFPNSQFFTYDKVDFAVGLEEDFNKKVSSLEETIAADPNNHKAVLLLGEIIYDTLNSRHEGAVKPANITELEDKMLKAFNKAAELKPGDELPYIYSGDHFVNKSIAVNDAREAHAAAMKTRTKPGAAASKEDLAKRDALDAEYGATLDKAAEPYEKAAAIFAKKEKLTGQDKQQYKKVAGYLGDIYMNKKIRANKVKATADATKYAADEKKWNDVYDTIK
ncbi:MAG: hypothetical protein WDO16_07585 [Bacteroidota bacterium]